MNNVIYKSIGSFTVINEYGLKLLFRFIAIENTTRIGQCHITLKFNDGRFRSRFISTSEMQAIYQSIIKINETLNIGKENELKGECFTISESSGLNYSILGDSTNGINFKFKVKAENYYYEFDITDHLETFKLFNQTDIEAFKKQLQTK